MEIQSPISKRPGPGNLGRRINAAGELQDGFLRPRVDANGHLVHLVDSALVKTLFNQRKFQDLDDDDIDDDDDGDEE